jgi:microcystin-dependent protein
MGTPYVGEIRIFAGNFAPAGWAFCDGGLLSISEYETLFQLIGTTYGGDGQSTYALPDLRSRVPIHWGTVSGGGSVVIGESGGVEQVTLTPNQMPAHSHSLIATGNTGSLSSPQGSLLAQSPSVLRYRPLAPVQAMAASSVDSVGGNQPHENMQPTLAINYIISLFGIFPSQN